MCYRRKYSVMAVDLSNRHMSFVAAFFSFVGVILCVIALATNYWTVENVDLRSKPVQTLNGTIFATRNDVWIWNVSFIVFVTD